MENVKMEFYSTSWCGPCKTMKPIIYNLQAMGWNIEIIDADANKEKVIENRISGIPTFIFYKDGVQVERFTGARPQSAILSTLTRVAK